MKPGLEGKSKPVLTQFLPFGYQSRVLGFLARHDYSTFTPEILLSGSYGSAKSILLAHIAVTHCLRWPGARVAICRRSLKDLKKTLYQEIVEHIENGENGPCLTERVHYWKRDNTAEIDFSNGSQIISVTWGDKLYDKFRSLKLSGVLIEELTENSDAFEKGFKMLCGRVGRIPTVPENFVICATNPGEPDSFWHKYFIENPEGHAHRMVFYSRTEDNFHLGPLYLSQQKKNLSALEAERYLEGKWISIEGKGIYHAYSEATNFRKQPYEFDWARPLHITFDFNTAEGKPQSAACFQLDKKKHFHFFEESVIDDANWCIDNLDEFDAKELFEREMQVGGEMRTLRVQKVIIHGDASGRARSSNSLRSNYDLIKEWFGTRNIPVEIQVPRSNPPLVKRWTIVNASCQNALKETILFVYASCPVLNTGMKLSRKKDGKPLEDDSKRYQHITTAAGYAVCYNRANEGRQSESRPV